MAQCVSRCVCGMEFSSGGRTKRVASLATRVMCEHPDPHWRERGVCTALYKVVLDPHRFVEAMRGWRCERGRGAPALVGCDADSAAEGDQRWRYRRRVALHSHSWTDSMLCVHAPLLRRCIVARTRWRLGVRFAAMASDGALSSLSVRRQSGGDALAPPSPLIARLLATPRAHCGAANHDQNRRSLRCPLRRGSHHVHSRGRRGGAWAALRHG